MVKRVYPCPWHCRKGRQKKNNSWMVTVKCDGCNGRGYIVKEVPE